MAHECFENDEIALAHLNEFLDYYTRLGKMEREAEGR